MQVSRVDCKIKQCPKPVRRRGWCSSHYYRWQKYGDPLYRRPTAEERFWAKVSKDGPAPAHRPELGPCWVWTASTAPAGYGQFYMGGRLQGAHIASWILANGALPSGMRVLHHCDNPPCIRPSHLFAGTQLDNVRDMISKGRRVAVSLKGEQNSHAKLTAAKVVTIRQRFEAGELGVALAAEYGVKFNAISRIVTGVSWKHAGGPIRPLDHPRRRRYHLHPDAAAVPESQAALFDLEAS